MTGVCIRDDRSEVVDGRSKFLPLRHGTGPCPALFTIVKQLGGEQLGDLVRDGVGGVVCKAIRRCNLISSKASEVEKKGM